MKADSPELKVAKAAVLKEHAATLQKERGLSFANAWAQATQAHPELVEQHGDGDEEATAAEPVYRYDPARVRPAAKSKGTSWDDVLDLMGKYAKERGAKERVEAAPESLDDLKKGAVLVYGDAVPLPHTTLVHG
jgi:hypothetical protein